MTRLEELVLQVRRGVDDSYGFVGFDGAGKAVFYSAKLGLFYTPDMVVAKVEVL